MTDNTPHFDDRGRLIAPRYGDVYFSSEDGLAETRHVFLEGNRLAERFSAMKCGDTFTIAETGFGTGLNFLAAWQLFEQHAPADARLEVVSVEGYPLQTEMMRQVLTAWPELAAWTDQLLESWSPLTEGIYHRSFADGRIRLKLLIGEAAEMLGRLQAVVQAWFLDGFAPSRNPEMWSEAIFHAVARCTPEAGTFATYTSAGFVRRGLEAVGFDVEKKPGFGRKREMIAGRKRSAAPTRLARKERIVVIGSSLAGAFAANYLANPCHPVTVIERQALSHGELPSLVPRHAVLQPKISDMDDATGNKLREGYRIAMDILQEAQDHNQSNISRINWLPCGVFHAAVDARCERRLKRFIEQFGESGLCRWIDADQTLEEVGLALPVGGVVIDKAGVLRPAGLCAALLDRPSVNVQAGVGAAQLERTTGGWRVILDDGSHIEAGVVVVANAFEAIRFEQTRHLPLTQVRGQVTLLRSGAQAGKLESLRRAMFFGGYMTPHLEGVQMLGASFVRDDAEDAWRDSEHFASCERLARLLPDEADRLRQLPYPAGWVGHRTTTPTGRAYCEQIDAGLYVSLGHGSHGIASAAYSAKQLYEMFIGEPWLTSE